MRLNLTLCVKCVTLCVYFVLLLHSDDKMTVSRARKVMRFLSQPFHVAEVFTGSPGKYVELKDTVSGFKGLLEGQYDDLPEMAFYMVGDINEAIAKADELAKQVA